MRHLIENLETWLERIYQAEEFGFAQKIAELDAAGRWRKLEQSRLFRTYPFSDKEAHLHHWVLAYQQLEVIA